MTTKISKQVIKRKKIVFRFESPDAESVFLVGSFNNWDKTRHPMIRNGNGVWSKTVTLNQGTYQYKFIADDRWRQDPENEKVISNEFGTQNNIIDVK
jgi:1,4-alpha-glucan branching enzyme